MSDVMIGRVMVEVDGEGPAILFVGVACIPPETFYSHGHMHIGHGYVRFAFCKSDELLRQVQERLAKLGST